MPRRKQSLDEQIRNILEKYIDYVETAQKKAIDKGAKACLEAVKKDAPVADETIIRVKKSDENALVEAGFGNKKAKSNRKVVYKPGYYRDGFATKQDKVAKRLATYGKIIYNKRQPHLTHLLENGHKKVLWGIRTNGKVDPKPHIEDNGNRYGELVLEEIDKFLKKGGKQK